MLLATLYCPCEHPVAAGIFGVVPDARGKSHCLSGEWSSQTVAVCCCILLFWLLGLFILVARLVSLEFAILVAWFVYSGHSEMEAPSVEKGSCCQEGRRLWRIQYGEASSALQQCHRAYRITRPFGPSFVRIGLQDHHQWLASGSPPATKGMSSQ